ncbi:hypothetical protein [Pararhizobium arenae]|uniref:hypothetical protein n=1 Tax=Pararhizobium arenae TaxID=1856850 RepID=UPI00094B4CC3|nr:hypothetical protein [Pararhizobium arenae]
MSTISRRTVIGVLTPLIGLIISGPALASETIKLDDGTTCTIIENTGSKAGGGTSTTVTADGGRVTSSTTVDGQTNPSSAGSGTSSSSAASSTSSVGEGQALSTSSYTRPDGSLVTRRSDGTCDITKPTQ